MIDTLEFYEELKEALEPAAAKKIAELLGKLYRDLKNTVTKAEFERLTDVVSELVQSQKQLVEAQKRSEQRLDSLALKMEELAEAQKKTEQRLDSLTLRVEELAEAQKKTEQRLDSLTLRVEELAEAQKKTEEELKILIQEHKKTREMVAGLSDTVGYGLEDKIMPYIIEFARKEYKIEVSLIDRKNMLYPDGRYDEINIYVEGRKNGEKVYMVGECKARPSKKDIERFSNLLKRLSNYIGGSIYPFVVGYYYSPDVEKYLKEKHPDIKALKSFEFEMKYSKQN
ncbi:MAG: hypothetical protein HXY52_04065 [Nitrospirae bacterium]|nr:hypothetical protein [Nitrospirota bacterium]